MSAFRESLPTHHVEAKRLRKAIAKLKNGKGSPDGCTAEIYKQLPWEALRTLIHFFYPVLGSLLFPGGLVNFWRSLDPKGGWCCSVEQVPRHCMSACCAQVS